MAIGHVACLLLVVGVCCAIPEWYAEQRRDFIREERGRRTGNHLLLNSKEQLVNHFLMLSKYSAITRAVWTNEPFVGSRHFFEEKSGIDDSVVFKIIQKMPKGGVLHVHNHAMTDIKWMVQHLTYLENLYTKNNSHPREYQFANERPGDDWVLLQTLREESGNLTAFDRMLEKELSVWTADPDDDYPSINDVWGVLNNYFFTAGGFWDSDEVNNLYFREAIKQFYDDGIQYIEIRSSPDEGYVNLMQEVVAEFKKEHEDFIGIKHIFAKSRSKTRDQMEEEMDETIRLMKKYPDLIKGFDMVSQEDVSNMQRYFLDQLLDKDNLDFQLPYFFHAGETSWTQAADQNLVDAVLLNASRIGHGFAILRHPKVLEKVRNHEIAVELCPISNQVLGLVSDLRNHPGAVHIANGDSVVVSSDDPVVWSASPLSHDFYYAFMSLGAVTDDLRLFKKLILNSFTYSSMTEDEKVHAEQMWRPRWEQFIDEVIDEYNLLDFGPMYKK